MMLPSISVVFTRKILQRSEMKNENSKSDFGVFQLPKREQKCKNHHLLPIFIGFYIEE
jgi:hypothetical protein